MHFKHAQAKGKKLATTVKDPITGKTKVTGNKANLKESEFDPYCCPS